MVDFSKIDQMNENEILNNQEYLNYLNTILKFRQFSEKFLVETINYYDPYTCLKYQNNLTPYFCFKYLYNNDNYYYADNWISYSDITDYIADQDIKYSDDEINFFYKESLK